MDTIESVEIELPFASTVMTQRMFAFVAQGLKIGSSINCFEYVPSNPQMLHAALSAIRPGRYCEWGSGMGIGVGIAEMLGFRAVGFEIDPNLAAASRKLLSDFGLSSEIVTASFFDVKCVADVYFVYGWPSLLRDVRPYFASVGLSNSKLLICNGAEDLRCEVLPSASTENS